MPWTQTVFVERKRRLWAQAAQHARSQALLPLKHTHGQQYRLQTEEQPAKAQQARRRLHKHKPVHCCTWCCTPVWSRRCARFGICAGACLWLRLRLLTAADTVINGALRGIGQVMFANSPLAGLVIMLALCIATGWHYTLLGTVGKTAVHSTLARLCCSHHYNDTATTTTFTPTTTGVLAGTSLATALGLARPARVNGLYGFNAVLVGQAAATFMVLEPAEGSATTTAHMLWTAVVLVALFAGLSTVVNEALASLLVPQYKVPPFTLAFNIATLLLLAAVGVTPSDRMQLASFLAPPVPSGAVLQQGYGRDPTAVASETVFASLSTFVGIVFRGVAQVYLCSSANAGAVVALGIALWSPIAAVFAVLGSAIGTLTAVAIGAPAAGIEFGALLTPII